MTALAPSGEPDSESNAGSSAPHLNRLLCALAPAAYAQLLPDLELVTLSHGEVVYEPGVPMRYVYFPETAVFSMVRHMADGSKVEVGIIGRDGVVGGSIALGAVSMPTQCIAQVAGRARRLPSRALIGALAGAPDLEGDGERPGAGLADLLHRYAQALFEQVAQSAACNRLHTLEQRCARWLLMTQDRVIGDELVLTQEFLSYMLGVRRAGVTEACGQLQRSGLIRYHHGRITVTDRPGLEVAACECYRTVVAEYMTLLGAALGPCATDA